MWRCWASRCERRKRHKCPLQGNDVESRKKTTHRDSERVDGWSALTELQMQVTLNVGVWLNDGLWSLQRKVRIETNPEKSVLFICDFKGSERLTEISRCVRSVSSTNQFLTCIILPDLLEAGSFDQKHILYTQIQRTTY